MILASGCSPFILIFHSSTEWGKNQRVGELVPYCLTCKTDKACPQRVLSSLAIKKVVKTKAPSSSKAFLSNSCLPFFPTPAQSDVHRETSN